jgi:hypothetical protein
MGPVMKGTQMTTAQSFETSQAWPPSAAMTLLKMMVEKVKPAPDGLEIGSLPPSKELQ